MIRKRNGDLTRERILEHVVQLINVRGYHGSSVSDILKAAGAKKGNYYCNFLTKEDFIVTILFEARKKYFDYLSGNITGSSELEKITSLIEAVFAYHRQRQFIGGCVFGNIALETADQSPALRTIVHEAFTQWIALLAKLLEKAKESGELDPAFDPSALARHIIALLEGGIMLSRVSRNGADLRACIDSMRLVLGLNGSRAGRKKKIS